MKSKRNVQLNHTHTTSDVILIYLYHDPAGCLFSSSSGSELAGAGNFYSEIREIASMESDSLKKVGKLGSCQ